jgi:hypothetical protein
MTEAGVAAAESAAPAAAAAAKEETKAPTTKKPMGAKRTYELVTTGSNQLSSPKSKKAKSPAAACGVLLQTGTLDTAIVGRARTKMLESYHLFVPTQILPGIKIRRAFTSGNAAHSIALSDDGTAYGWGRNEANQLGMQLPVDVVLPTPLALPFELAQAALGKHHTIFLATDGALFAVGANKAGQCGVRPSTDSVANYRKCALPDDEEICKISCGEDFSVALSTDGVMYTTGSSEYGQLGNGETGEYFITANKLGFANCDVFTARNRFCHGPNDKVVALSEDVKFCEIACGKHHTIALEAPSDDKQRLFSWGCGDCKYSKVFVMAVRGAYSYISFSFVFSYRWLPWTWAAGQRDASQSCGRI